MRIRRYSAGLLLILGLSHGALAVPVPLDRLEASVNSALILLSDVVRFRKTEKLRTQIDPLFAGTVVGSKGDKAANEEIVQFLIDERLIVQAFPVTDSEVEGDINQIQNSNHLDRPGLRKFLQDQGYSFEDYFELIRAGKSKQLLIERDIRTKVTVSDDDVKNFYSSHYSQGAGIPHAYRLRLILVSPKSYKSANGARETAQKALKELKDGESFEEVAKRVSDDASASSGGDLGELTEDQMSPAIRSGLKNLKIGDVSPLLGDAKSGFLILKLIGEKTEAGEQYNKLKEEIRNQLVAAEYQHQIQLWIQRQRQNAFVHLAGEPPVAGIPGAIQAPAAAPGK